MDLLGYRLGNLWQQAPYVTANVNLWPQMLAIIGNPDRLASLSVEQRDSLTRAVQEAAAASTGLVEGDDRFIADLCREGARFANASDADILGLRDAFAQVYKDLRRTRQRPSSSPRSSCSSSRARRLSSRSPMDAPALPPAHRPAVG